MICPKTKFFIPFFQFYWLFLNKLIINMKVFELKVMQYWEIAWQKTKSSAGNRSFQSFSLHRDELSSVAKCLKTWTTSKLRFFELKKYIIFMWYNEQYVLAANIYIAFVYGDVSNELMCLYCDNHGKCFRVPVFWLYSPLKCQRKAASAWIKAGDFIEKVISAIVKQIA